MNLGCRAAAWIVCSHSSRRSFFATSQSMNVSLPDASRDTRSASTSACQSGDSTTLSPSERSLHRASMSRILSGTVISRMSAGVICLQYHAVVTEAIRPCSGNRHSHQRLSLEKDVHPNTRGAAQNRPGVPDERSGGSRGSSRRSTHHQRLENGCIPQSLPWRRPHRKPPEGRVYALPPTPFSGIGALGNLVLEAWTIRRLGNRSLLLCFSKRAR